MIYKEIYSNDDQKVCANWILYLLCANSSETNLRIFKLLMKIVTQSIFERIYEKPKLEASYWWKPRKFSKKYKKRWKNPKDFKFISSKIRLKLFEVSLISIKLISKLSSKSEKCFTRVDKGTYGQKNYKETWPFSRTTIILFFRYKV